VTGGLPVTSKPKRPVTGKPFCSSISSEGPPYEVEVYYDGDREMFFKGGWTRLTEDYDLHQGWLLLFDYHCGTEKFDVKIFVGTQCLKKYEAEVYFH
jgi:hypothetical protein